MVKESKFGLERIVILMKSTLVSLVKEKWMGTANINGKMVGLMMVKYNNKKFII